MKAILPTLALLIAAPLLLGPASLQAESVQIPVASQGGQASSVQRPSAGMTGHRVLERFGEPLRTMAPVGDPPITRWEYPEFFVYFEYNHVVHAVLKHRPKG